MDNALNYILIAMLVIVLLHLMFKTLNNCSSCKIEKMGNNKLPDIDSVEDNREDNENNSELMEQFVECTFRGGNGVANNCNDSIKQRIQHNRNLSEFIGGIPDGDIGHSNYGNKITGSNDDMTYAANDNSESTDNNETPSPNRSTLDFYFQPIDKKQRNAETQIDKFIREYVNNGRNIDHEEGNINFTKRDVNRYRENYLEFNNNINKSSNGVDMVDRVNDMYLKGEGDVTKSQNGKSIAEVFDEMNHVYSSNKGLPYIKDHPMLKGYIMQNDKAEFSNFGGIGNVVGVDELNSSNMSTRYQQV